MSDRYEVEVKGQGLSVNGDTLALEETSPEALQTMLAIGRKAIVEGIDSFYEETKRKYAGQRVVRPSIFVLRFGVNSKKKQIFTQEGLDNATNVHKSPDEIRSKYRPYWHAVEDGGFVPEVRSVLTGPSVGGIWLMLRDEAD